MFTAKTALKSLAATVLVASAIAPSMAGQQVAALQARASYAIKCTVPNNVACTITSTKGIMQVTIKTESLGETINLVNKSYEGCPKEVKVTWDSAYQSTERKVVECSGVVGTKLKTN